MNKTKEELVKEIEKNILQAANNTSDQWVFAGYIVTVRKGSIEMIDFFFNQNIERGFLEDKKWFKELRNNFKALCNLKKIKEDNSWIKCKAILHKDGDFKIVYEKDNPLRWSISPTNIKQAYDILISEISLK